MPCRRAVPSLSNYSNPDSVSHCQESANTISHSHKVKFKWFPMQFFCKHCFLQVRFTELAFLHWAMDVDLKPMDEVPPFCGCCYQESGPSSNFRPFKGRWQPYGDHRLGEKFWIYLCWSCNNSLWRLYSKGEEWHDNQSMCMEYLVFLKHELANRK